MKEPSYAFVLVALVIFGYQIHVTVKLARSEYYDGKQKIAQLALIWILPILGATVVHWFLTHGTSDTGLNRTDRNHIPQERNDYGR